MAAPRLDSAVDILKTQAAIKKGLGTTQDKTEVNWPKPQFVSTLSQDVSLRGERKVDNVGSIDED